jgi:exosome complex component MTR3
VTILEGEEDVWCWGTGDDAGIGKGWGAMGVLAGCVSVASVALVDAGIDVLDIVVGGVAAVVPADGSMAKSKSSGDSLENGGLIVLDPNPVEHENIIAACTVGYIVSRDEMSLLWLKGAISGPDSEKLIDAAVKAARATKRVVEETVRDATEVRLQDT